MRVWVLGSGSRGNAVLIEDSHSRVLVDAGFPPHVLTGRLTAAGVPPQSVDALVITHEHTDHVRGARGLAARFGWPVYATSGTIISARDLRDAKAMAFGANDTLSIGTIDITAVRAPHDAAEPVIVVATARPTGARAGIAYDLGSITQPIADALRDLDVLVLESNHDESMLRNGPYPASIRARIAGRRGHLSNRAAAQIARQVAHRSLRHIVLAHLSETCNDPGLAVRTMNEALVRSRFGGRVSVATQDSVVGPFTAGPSRPSAVQLTLDI